MKKYIINGLVCLEHELKKCDIEITNERISAIADKLPRDPDAEVIDGNGFTLIPGIVDFHTHLEEKGQHFTMSDTYRSGTKLAVLSGITTVNAFIIQGFNQSLAQAISSVAAQAEHNAYCDYRWHLTPIRFSDINYTDIGRWIEKGFTTYKFYTTYKQANLFLSYERLSEVIRRMKKFEPQFIIHCEDETILNQSKNNDFYSALNYAKIHNEEAELTAVEKVIGICRATQTQVHIAHVSSSDAFGQIELAKRDCAITCETTPPYIFLNDNKLAGQKHYRYLSTPPLRSEECRHLMEVKTSMGYPEILASNHKAFFDEDYETHQEDYRSLPNGLPSMGALFPLFYDLLVNKYQWDLPKLMKKLSVNPATAAKIYPQKGVIAVGSDADIVMFNPKGASRPIISSFTQNYNIWEDFNTAIEIKHVFLRGQQVVKDGQLSDEQNCTGKALCHLT